MEDYDKVAIVGVNGAGKSTLLKIIIGELPADSGLCTLSKGKTLGYLAQQHAVNQSVTIWEELIQVRGELIAMDEEIRSLELQMKTTEGTALDALYKRYSTLTHQYELENGYAYQSEVTGILKGLGFAESEFTKQIQTLSGGQKKIGRASCRERV